MYTHVVGIFFRRTKKKAEIDAFQCLRSLRRDYNVAKQVSEVLR